MIWTHGSPAFRATLVLCGIALLGCGSGGSGGGGGGGACYADSDGINGGDYTFDLTVDDTAFSKTILTTENDARATVTLTNTGTKPHGFEVGCVDYPDPPPGCTPKVCFPADATIAPLAPGASATITFDTPTADGVIYPFKSSEPNDSSVPGLNDGQWTLM
jgi:hypothetical protein